MMRNALQVVVLISSLISLGTQARVIYGEDNRTEVSEASSFHQVLAKSAATMISKSRFSKDDLQKGVYNLNQRTLGEWLIESQKNNDQGEDEDKTKFLRSILSPILDYEIINQPLSICDGERFVDQPINGMCSGFLIAPDLLVTAGHCLMRENACDEFKWVFDYVVDPVTKQAGVGVKEENIYSCKKIVSSSFSMSLDLDYAVIQLDRRVSDRAPLKIRNSSTVEDFAPLVIIGSPAGLPLKVAAGANVRDNSHPFYFKANLDSYQGNSGSPVFDAVTGVVEGILVRGDDDFVLNRENMCVQSNKCPDDGCLGEDISRLTSIPEVAIQEAFNRAATDGNIPLLEQILELDLWIDFNTGDGETALMKASRAGQVEAMKLLISHGADIGMTDARGYSALEHYLQGTTTSNSSEALALLK